MTNVDVLDLEQRVKDMYRSVAEQPGNAYHFETGRSLAERLGYPIDVLDDIPAGAVESFAGVGYFFDLAALQTGETVLDLGSGSGMDLFAAARAVGRSGRVIGVDFTEEQLLKARRLATEGGFDQVDVREGRIEWLPVEDQTVDCVISNGVINLSPSKDRVFAEATRVLRRGGRLAVADIVSERQLDEAIVCDARLWASCIGGASQERAYSDTIEAAGLRIEAVRENAYRFISEQAQGATKAYGVKSISLLAIKP